MADSYVLSTEDRAKLQKDIEELRGIETSARSGLERELSNKFDRYWQFGQARGLLGADDKLGEHEKAYRKALLAETFPAPSRRSEVKAVMVCVEYPKVKSYLDSVTDSRKTKVNQAQWILGPCRKLKDGVFSETVVQEAVAEQFKKIEDKEQAANLSKRDKAIARRDRARTTLVSLLSNGDYKIPEAMQTPVLVAFDAAFAAGTLPEPEVQQAQQQPAAVAPTPTAAPTPAPQPQSQVESLLGGLTPEALGDVQKLVGLLNMMNQLQK